MKKLILLTSFIVSFSFVIKGQAYSYGLHPELGGFVFQLSEDKMHGLVAETKDLGSFNWYDATNKLNYEIMKPLYSSYGANFSDWRLPTIHELYLMYRMKHQIGGFNMSGCCGYWSSTAAELKGFDGAKIKYFNNAEQTEGVKSHSNLVRPVRSF